VHGGAMVYYFKTTEVHCSYKCGMRVCQGGFGHGYARGGTTIGNTYMAAPGRSNVTKNRIMHEKVHRAQWNNYGFLFSVLLCSRWLKPLAEPIRARSRAVQRGVRPMLARHKLVRCALGTCVAVGVLMTTACRLIRSEGVAVLV
jgi:hypothetical protein